MRAPRHAVIAVSAWRDPATGAEFHNWVRCATGGPASETALTFFIYASTPLYHPKNFYKKSQPLNYMTNRYLCIATVPMIVLAIGKL